MKLLFQLFLIALLDRLNLGIVRCDSICSVEGDCPNRATEEECVDTHESCGFWAENQECQENPDYMLVYCRKSCQVCYDAPTEEDFGIPQTTNQEDEVEILRAIEDMKEYFQKIRNDPSTNPKMHEVLDNCKLKHENCFGKFTANVRRYSKL
jgi:hypothetical protein